MHTQRVVQSSRVRRQVRKPVAVTRSTRKVGSRWRAAAVAMSLGCAAALGGCGGGGGGGEGKTDAAPATRGTAPPDATVPSPTKQVKIAMYGDSTTWGSTLNSNGVTVQTQNNEPHFLQSMMDEALGASTVSVENHGVPGSTAVELLQGTANIPRTWAAEMAQSKADIVVINEGINDSFIPTETDADLTYTYGQLVQIPRAAGKTVVLETSNPIYNSHNANLWGIVHGELSVASEWSLPVVDQYNLMVARTDWPTLLSSDGIHPTEAGYGVKAQNTMAVIDSIVKSALTNR